MYPQKPLDIKEATVVNLLTEDEELLSLLHLLGVLRDKKTFQCGHRDNGSFTSQWFKFTTHPNNDDSKPALAADIQLDSATILPAKIAEPEFERKSAERQKMGFYTVAGSDETGLRALVRGGDNNADILYELDWPDTVTPMMRKQAYRAWTRLKSDADTDLSDFKIRTTDRADNFEDLHASWPSLIIQVLILMAYGGVHLTAWNSHFPTKTERWLWRSSALLLAGTTPVLVGLAIPAVAYLFIDAVSSTMGKFLRFWFYALASLLVPATIVAYFFARVFLVVESFVSLRSVPIGVYSAVPWSSYLPHI